MAPSYVPGIEQLTPADQELFVKFGFGVTETPRFGTVHDAFEHYAQLQPDAVAVEDFEHRITYGELNRQADCISHILRANGVKQNARVVLLIERAIPMVLGIISILKAGATYLPQDGNVVKPETLLHIIKDSETPLVLCMRKFADRVGDAKFLCIEDVACMGDQCGHSALRLPVSGDDNAYCIYTSGTTGKPKGVPVSHTNVTNLICLSPGDLGMRPGKRVSQLMAPSFDMGAWEVLGSMANGATLVLRGKSSAQWRAVMKTVDIVVATPSMLTVHDPKDYPNIKTIAVAGEPCPQALADAWSHTARFHNGCGPTEVTIVNTLRCHILGEELSIGIPTPNNNVYILDENMRPVPIGEPGLMWNGGSRGGTTKGYLNLPEKTAERYQRDPFVNDGSIMFNTGDLGRWMADGRLEHLGRIDDQVKIKGFRVELDGVSAGMESCVGVKRAVAILIEKELYGFYSPASVPSEEVKAAVASVQPYYAVPTHFVGLETLPFTPNGKVDKRVLKDLVLNKENTEDTEAPNAPQEQAKVAPSAQVEPPASPQTEDIAKTLKTTGSISTLATITGLDEKASSPSSQEKGYAWEGYLDDEIPDKTQVKPIRNLRHIILTLYRRLFGVVFAVNMAVLVAIAVKGGANAQLLGKIVVANLCSAILMRQEYVINTFFNVACSVPPTWPLAIRRVCARVYHIGGLHSGFAVSGFAWLIYFTVQATIEWRQGIVSLATCVVTYLILALLAGIVTFAYPRLRLLYHDTFEMVHRLMGWTATILVWAQITLLTKDYKDPSVSLPYAMAHSAPFWLVLIMSLSLVLPWLRLRKVPVRSVVLSNHAIRLYFDYVTPIPGSFTRVSTSPLTEWHGFATIPEPGKTGYSLVVSKAGDWTSERINNPPTQLWVRGIPAFGVLRIVPLFNRLVVVATGSGIGPCAPCILEQRVPMRLLWTSPDVRKTFGDELVDSLLEKSPDAVIYDTRKHGKPDMVKLTYRLVKEFNAEAVCIISNQKLTEKVVYGMMSRGIPAFGAIWDS